MIWQMGIEFLSSFKPLPHAAWIRCVSESPASCFHRGGPSHGATRWSSRSSPSSLLSRNKSAGMNLYRHTLYQRSNRLLFATKSGKGDDFQRDDSYPDQFTGEQASEEEWAEDLDDGSGDAIEINTAGTDWGNTALKILKNIIADKEDLDLYSFRAVPSNKRMYIRIDKLSNQFGSPSLEELEELSACFNSALEASLGVELAGQLEVEMSSPGAERHVRVPQDLVRFHDLPMRVEYREDDGTDKSTVRIFNFISFEEEEAGKVTWKLADVRANRPGKGRGLNKRDRERVYTIPIASISHVSLHVDM